MSPSRLPFSNISNKPQHFPGTKVLVVDPKTSKKPSKAIAPAKKQKEASDGLIVAGSWTKHEHLTFLHCLRLHGPGKWKKFCELIPTRDNIQIKSHGQLLLRKHKNGINIFGPLDAYYQEQQRQRQHEQHRLGLRTNPQNMHFRTGYGHPPVFRRERQMPQQRLRPPSDVIGAACGLVQLSGAPRIFKGFAARGQPATAPASRIPKNAPCLRY